MSKRKIKSRLTKTDINKICEMQSKIDAYESYIIGLYGLVQREKETRYLVPLRGTEFDDFINTIWKWIEEIKAQKEL